MEAVTAEKLAVLLERAGLRPPRQKQEREHIRALFEHYMTRLKVLQAADLGEEEVASIFRP